MNNAFVDPVKPATQLPVSGETVLVGCKLLHGIVLENGRPGDDKYSRVELAGANTSVVHGGYGITRVSAAFMKEWMANKNNQKLSFVTKGFVFFHSQRESVESYFDGMKSERTGLERLNPAELSGRLVKLNTKD